MARITKPVEERRQEIIDTAHTMFMNNGFDKTQMADISKKMNVAAGTIYHYFKSRTDLLYAVIDKIVDEKMKNQSKQQSNLHGSAFDRLKQIILSFQNVEKLENISFILGNDPALIQYYLTKLNNSLSPFFGSLIEQGNADGSWKCEYPKETAIFILHGMAGVLADWHQLKESRQEKLNKIKVYTSMFLRVLGITEKEGYYKR